ncbi:MAG: PEP-CTERM sorting domain-containing protein [Pseudomonadales bacterium]|jgi:hypothetical protein
MKIFKATYAGLILSLIMLGISLPALAEIMPSSTGGSLGVKWNSTDFSTHVERLGPNQTFVWANQVTGELKVIPMGPAGGAAVITDAKTKKGKAALELLIASSLQDSSYGGSGEPAVPFVGQIDQGTGAFTFSISGLVGVDDVVGAPFSAALVSNSTDNPFNLGLFGQGDQLLPPKNGTVSYSSKWSSSDSILLSNGDELEIGDFYLNSFGPPTDFSFSLNPDFSGSGSFTVQEDFFFVNSLDLAPEGSNLRQSIIGGSVTKNFAFNVIPEPSSLLLLLLGIGILTLSYRLAAGGRLSVS